MNFIYYICIRKLIIKIKDMRTHKTSLLAIDTALKIAYDENPAQFTGDYASLPDELGLDEPQTERTKLPYLLSELNSSAFATLSSPEGLDFENSIDLGNGDYDYPLTINLDNPNPTKEWEDFANDVMDEYDANEEESPTWEEYGLSGDDDVDYNGSYILSLMDAIKYYMTYLIK